MDGQNSLTENEIKLLKTPLSQLRQTGLLPTALQALDRKIILSRAENAERKSSEEQ